MSVELRPLGVNCNIMCQYCYQNPLRDTGSLARRYDMEAMKKAIVEEGGPFALFGGEPLLLPLNDLEDLWAWGYGRYGRNSLQTNGTLISDEHIRLFKQYRVGVGISIDGPGELNDARWAGSLKETREATEKTEANIERLCRQGMAPSLIVTLHRGNATAEKLPRMHEWFRRLDRIGVRRARLHILEVENPSIQAKYALSTQENLDAFLGLAQLEKEFKQLQFDTFREMEALLMGHDQQVSCIWKACDPYTTRAVRGVEGFGQKSNCGRTNKEGVEFVKSETPGYERYVALYHTPQENLGCKGCRFFLMCKGQCPGTAEGGDWRNRTMHCQFWMTLFSLHEEKLMEDSKLPLSQQPELLAAIEQRLLQRWAVGDNPSIASILKGMDAEKNGHTQASSPEWVEHTDVPHIDKHVDTYQGKSGMKAENSTNSSPQSAPGTRPVIDQNLLADHADHHDFHIDEHMDTPHTDTTGPGGHTDYDADHVDRVDDGQHTDIPGGHIDKVIPEHTDTGGIDEHTDDHVDETEHSDRKKSVEKTGSADPKASGGAQLQSAAGGSPANEPPDADNLGVHTDEHTDIPHVDTTEPVHIDTPPQDNHTDYMSGEEHVDQHTDTPHADRFETGHTDRSHEDTHTDKEEENGNHVDLTLNASSKAESLEHHDFHIDEHIDRPHTDTTSPGKHHDTTSPHWDEINSDGSHTDRPAQHSDYTSDEEHTDEKEVDIHTDNHVDENSNRKKSAQGSGTASAESGDSSSSSTGGTAATASQDAALREHGDHADHIDTHTDEENTHNDHHRDITEHVDVEDKSTQ